MAPLGLWDGALVLAQTTRLGFGCASLDRMSETEALAVLETALESGIRHFDTAPLYGWGVSEQRLGMIAAKRRSAMTLVTKVGLDPPNLAQRAAAKLLKGLAPDSLNARRGRFSPPQVRASVERSLTALQTDHIDALLLHEVRAGEITSALLETLTQLKREGKIGRLGIATKPDETAAILKTHGGLFEIVQIALSGLEAVDASGADVQRIVHSVLGARLAAIHQKLTHNAATAERFAKEFGFSPQDRAGLAALLLHAALERNPGGVTLFSSSDRTHIRSAALLASEPNAVKSKVAPLLGAFLADT